MPHPVPVDSLRIAIIDRRMPGLSLADYGYDVVVHGPGDELVPVR